MRISIMAVENASKNKVSRVCVCVYKPKELWKEYCMYLD